MFLLDVPSNWCHFDPQTLKEIDLHREWNSIEARGTEHLADGLKVNRVRQEFVVAMHLVVTIAPGRH